MATFVVIPTSDEHKPRIDQEIRAQFLAANGVHAYEMPRGEWLVEFDGTTKQLAEKINLSGTSNAVVLNYSGYWGFASRDIWEWIQQHAR